MKIMVRGTAFSLYETEKEYNLFMIFFLFKLQIVTAI